MNRKKELTLLFTLFIFCLAIRLALLSQKNMWFDEIYSWHITQGSFRDIIKETSIDIHPPLYYFILKIWEQIFGQSVTALRVLSVLIGSSAIFFIYPISKKVLSIEKSILVILLYSISPLSIFFSQEVRMPILNLLLNAGSIYFFILMIDSEAGLRNIFKNFNTYAYIVFTELALYTHYYSFFILFAQILYLVYFYKDHMKRAVEYVICFLIIGLLYFPWFPTMLNQIRGGQSWRNSQTFSGVITEFYNFVKDMSMGFYHRYANQGIANVLGFITLFVFCIVLIVLFKKIFEKKSMVEEKDYVSYRIRFLIIFTVFIPVVLSILISFRQWIEHFRYLSIIIPFFLIVLLLSLEALDRKVQFILVIMFILINIYGDFLYYKADFKNNDYRDLISVLDTRDIDNAKIFVYPHYYSWIIDYYRIENALGYPEPINYGWEFSMLTNSINAEKPANFWLIMDYHSEDQSTYSYKLGSLEKVYKINYEKKFEVEPDTVALYKLVRREGGSE